jgi:hypothetical protein
MNSLPLFLKFARYRYICYRLSLRIRMGRKKRDAYLAKHRSSPRKILYYGVWCEGDTT